MDLNDRISELEKQVKALESKVADLSKNTEEGAKPPYSVVGSGKDTSLVRPIDIKTGLGQALGNPVIWNNEDAEFPPANAEPPEPSKGYNKHSHSRYNGGALINDVLEIVEYVWHTLSYSITNKHCPQYWEANPKIATVKNSKGNDVPKIGLLDLVFNPDTLKWGTAAFEIDVKKCYIVERDDNGNIVKDSKGIEKKSPLFNTDQTKTAIIWDENAGCWRFYATYAPGE